ncbi:MAG: hypothetical protein E7165_02655 [Firmicutes bacterium]|nr:hypothetical protein [Bacillota bacterium]
MKKERKSSMDSNELQSKFTEYIDQLKNQSVNIKRNEIINSLKELISILEVVYAKEGIKIEYLKSDEIRDLENNDASEDDFLESCIVYVENVKNIVSKYLMHKL